MLIEAPSERQSGAKAKESWSRYACSLNNAAITSSSGPFFDRVRGFAGLARTEVSCQVFA
jgi:hypothetical protein